MVLFSFSFFGWDFVFLFLFLNLFFFNPLSLSFFSFRSYLCVFVL